MAFSWRVAFALDRRELDGETVAYCDDTGDTFKVAPVADAILKAVAAGTHNLESLSDHVARTLGTGGDPEVTAIIEQAVEDLESLGIIERVSL